MNEMEKKQNKKREKKYKELSNIYKFMSLLYNFNIIQIKKEKQKFFYRKEKQNVGFYMRCYVLI